MELAPWLSTGSLGWCLAERGCADPPADVRGALIRLMPLSSAEPRLRGVRMSDLAAQQRERKPTSKQLLAAL